MHARADHEPRTETRADGLAEVDVRTGRFRNPGMPGPSLRTDYPSEIRRRS